MISTYINLRKKQIQNDLDAISYLPESEVAYAVWSRLDELEAIESFLEVAYARTTD